MSKLSNLLNYYLRTGWELQATRNLIELAIKVRSSKMQLLSRLASPRLDSPLLPDTWERSWLWTQLNSRPSRNFWVNLGHWCRPEKCRWKTARTKLSMCIWLHTHRHARMPYLSLPLSHSSLATQLYVPLQALQAQVHDLTPAQTASNTRCCSASACVSCCCCGDVCACFLHNCFCPVWALLLFAFLLLAPSFSHLGWVKEYCMNVYKGEINHSLWKWVQFFD